LANYAITASTTTNIRNAAKQTAGDVSISLTGAATSQPVRYYYRVRADSNCSDDHSAYSKVVSVVVTPPEARSTSVDFGVQNGITQQIVLPAQNPPVTFSAHGDKPWITVSPAVGTVGPQGVILTVTLEPSPLK